MYLKEVILAHLNEEINHIPGSLRANNPVTRQGASNPSEDVQMKNLTQNKVEEYVWKEKQKTSELPVARRFILGSY